MRLVALGDSITWGYPVGDSISWTSKLRDRLGVDLINAGVNGDTLDAMRRRIPRDVIPFRPTHAVVLGGANDAWMGASSAEMIADYEKIHADLALAGVETVAAFPTPAGLASMERELRSFRAGIAELARRNRLVLIDFHSCLTSPETGARLEGHFIDEAHPSESGFERMFEAAAPAVTRILKTI